MKNYEIESAFSYKGFNCVVVKLGLDCMSQWRCGYVELKEANKNLTEDDAECLINCHGGITFYGTRDAYGLGLSVGFDCNHLEDSLETCSLEYCINQCKKIADQLDILANGGELPNPWVSKKFKVTIIADEDVIDELSTYDSSRVEFVGEPEEVTEREVKNYLRGLDGEPLYYSDILKSLGFEDLPDNKDYIAVIGEHGDITWEETAVNFNALKESGVEIDYI